MSEAIDFMQKVRNQNKARAAKHYDANKEAVNAKRRAAYLAKKEAQNPKEPEPVVEQIKEKVIKPSQIPRPVKRLVVLPEPELMPGVVKRTKKFKIVPAPAPEPEPVVEPVAPKQKIKINKMTAEKAIELLTTLDGAAMRTSTANTRTEDFKRLMSVTGNPTNVLEILKKPKETIKMIDSGLQKNGVKLYANNSLKSVYEILVTFIDILGREKYKKQHALFNEQFDIRKLDSVADNIEKKKLKGYTGDTFTKYLATVKDTFGGLSKMYVLSRLYYELPIRDDFVLKITDKHPTTKESSVIVMPAKGKAMIHVFNYKTDSKYGDIEKTISLPLTKLIRNYMEANDLNVGDYLFGDKKLTGFVSGNNKKFGLAGGITNFREMKIAEMYADPDISSKKKVKLAYEMKHGVNTQLWYLGRAI